MKFSDVFKEVVGLSFRLGPSDLTQLEKFREKPLPTVAPHLVVAYHLAEVYPWVKESPGFTEDGFSSALAWWTARGRPEALTTALSWLGLNNFRLQERGLLTRWSSCQIGVPTPLTAASVEAIHALFYLSAPARAHLERVYVIRETKEQGEQGRLLVLSQRNAVVGRGVLSSDAGTYDEKKGMVIDAA